MSATILPFHRSRRQPTRHCVGCGSHFAPMAEHHVRCRRCWGWSQAGRFLTAAARALNDAERSL